jgi:phytoene synthase
MRMHSSELQPADLQACINMMRGGSKSFFAASKLLPERVRFASVALYAFCRVADDLVDEGADSAQALRELQQRLDGIYSGQPQAYLEDNALAHVAQQYALPRNMLEALIEGFEWDANGKTYETKLITGIATPPPPATPAANTAVTTPATIDSTES